MPNSKADRSSDLRLSVKTISNSYNFRPVRQILEVHMLLESSWNVESRGHTPNDQRLEKKVENWINEPGPYLFGKRTLNLGWDPLALPSHNQYGEMKTEHVRLVCFIGCPGISYIARGLAE